MAGNNSAINIKPIHRKYKNVKCLILLSWHNCLRLNNNIIFKTVQKLLLLPTVISGTSDNYSDQNVSNESPQSRN